MSAFFSASRVLGSRSGSVGVAVSNCPGCAWVWSSRSKTAKPSLALALSPASAFLAKTLALNLAKKFFVSVSVRRHGGHTFLRVHGSKATLLDIAKWWVS